MSVFKRFFTNHSLELQMKIIFLLFYCIVFPDYAWASGGAPLLLVFNLSVFIVGLVWIFGIEYLIYRRMVDSSKSEAFWDVVTVNTYSTTVVAFGIPLIISFLGVVGSFIPGQTGKIISVVATLVQDNAQYGKLAVYMAFVWFAVLFVVTVFFESWLFRKRWSKRDFDPKTKPVKLCWYCNAVSHLGLLLAIVLIWHELL
jgi:uncharacterized membrane protein YoaK (UPF0700 family)